jgi:hypothetical protein
VGQFWVKSNRDRPLGSHDRSSLRTTPTGGEGKIVVGDREPQPDRTLVRALSQAHLWTAELRSGKPLSEIAAATTHSESYIRTRSQLAFLSPTIQSAILAGRLPKHLTLERIIRKPMPLDWDAQAIFYGFEEG